MEYCEMNKSAPILSSKVFKPGIFEFFGSDGLEVGADNICLDFSGVVLVGGTQNRNDRNEKSLDLLKELYYIESKDEKEVERVNNLGFCGVGLLLKGLKNVTIRGLTAKGFRIGVVLVDCENIIVENCVFSDNFHDPECGWDEHGPGGGIFLLRSRSCIIKRNRANHVWNGIYLRESDNNIIENNDFSFASNMCVKMWNSSYNVIDKNNLSWGLRIRPGEVHARDSAGLLMDSRCDHNRITNNDITHGGDGIFVRALNGWQSCHNIFINNDCSYANNNAIEAWSNHNTYIRNKANDSSYGFWLGGSDFTVLYENEACRNGIKFANAPESFGTCGIAVSGGSGNNFQLIGNKICDNRGPGVAVRFQASMPVFHWVLEDNIICRNHSTEKFVGHGIYMKNAGNFVLSNNKIEENDGQAIYRDDEVFDVKILQNGNNPIRIKGEFPEDYVRCGEPLPLKCAVDTAADSFDVKWTFGDGTISMEANPWKTYEIPGSYYLGVTASNECRSAIDGSVVYVLPKGKQMKISAAKSVGEENVVITQICSDQVTLYSEKGYKREIRLQIDEMEIEKYDSLGLYLKLISTAETDWEKSVKSPVLKLLQDEQNYITVIPKQLTSDGVFAGKTWEKCGKRYYQFPIAVSNDLYTVTKTGNPRCIRELSVCIQHKNIGFIYAEVIRPTLYVDVLKTEGCNIGDNSCTQLLRYPKLISSEVEGNKPEEILSPSNVYAYEATNFWHVDGETTWLGIEWSNIVEVNQLLLGVVPDDLNDTYEVTIQYQENEEWMDICNKTLKPMINVISFDVVRTAKVRVLFQGNSPRIYRLTAFGKKNSHKESTAIAAIQCKPFVETDGSKTLSNLIVKIYRVENKIPVGEAIFSKIIPKESIVSGKINTFFLGTEELPEGRYAVAFTQEKLAASRTEGEHYRFCAAYVNRSEYSGIGVSGIWKNETDVFGNLWLRIITDDRIVDYAHEGEGMGPRAGLVDCEYRYQTFTL